MDDSHSKDFRKACGAISVYYDEKSGQLSVIVDQEAGVKRANLLIEQHLKNVRQKINLLRRTQELAQQIEVLVFCSTNKLRIFFSIFYLYNRKIEFN